jgi:DNA-binding response OmpR family regulator
MSPRVLLVDDEPQIRHILRAYLEKDDFDVLEVDTGDAAVTLTTDPTTAVDLVVLDVGLPDIDGIEVLRRLRAAGDVPVILVTARSEELDKLVGLAVGADDYIVKPFSPREVVARVKTVLRRAQSADSRAVSARARAESGEESWSFPDLVIDPPRRELRRGGEPVALSALEFDILAALASAPGRVFSRAQLLERVWGYDFYGDERVVDVHIRSIRRQLADDAADPTIIGTVRGVGYKFLQERLR